jgi:hypothetical protein
MGPAILLLLALVAIARVSATPVITPNASIQYTITVLPVNGTLYQAGSPIHSVPFPVNSTISYRASSPYDFSVTNATTSCTKPYESFPVNVVYLPSLANGTVTIHACIVDQQNLPIANDITVFALNTTFQLIITDPDDRVGLSDGLVSRFSFHDGPPAFTSLAAGSFVFFNTSGVTALGNLTECGGAKPVIVSGGTYPTDTFCFASNGQEGSVIVEYSAVDKAGGVSAVPGKITITSNILIASDVTVSTNQNNLTAIAIPTPLPVTSLYITPFSYAIFVESVPVTGVSVYYNGSRLVSGITIPADANLSFVPDSGYYNRLYFPQYAGGYHQSVSDDHVTFRAVNNTLDVVSAAASIAIYVDHTIIENLQACTLYPYSPWPLEACTSYGETSSLIPIYVGGSDGRDDPAYTSVILSLPAHGTLYHNSATNNGTDIYVVGDPVQVGDVIPRLSGFFAVLLYVSDVGYYNSLKYDSAPENYVSLTNDLGEYVLNCTANCGDTFFFKTVSGLNSSLESAPLQGKYSVMVTKTVYDQLTACPSDGFSIWNHSCVSFGRESNDIFGQYVTPIYLNVNNTNNETYTYVLTSLPLHGTLYVNDTQLAQVGDIIYPNENISVPLLTYVGDPDYFNDVLYDTNPLLLYVDQKNKPLLSCPNADSDGCPDRIGFYVVTESGRKSNPANYAVFIHSGISNATLTGPDSLVFIPGIPRNLSITYDDPDGDVYVVYVQISLYDGSVFYPGSLDGLTFPSPNTCFNSTTGCTEQVDFIGLPSDIEPVLAGLMFYSEEEVQDDDSETISISVIKRFPDGIEGVNSFRNDPNDTVIGCDVTYYSNVSQFGDDYDDMDDYFDTEAENTACEHTNTILVITLPIIAGLLLILIIAVLYCIVQVRKRNKVNEI